METDMKGMHGHYKELLGELDKCYSGIELDTHKKYKDFIEKWKGQMDKKCKSLKMAYEEEHKLREELRTWAELNMIALQEKVKELSEDKKKSLERLDLVMAGGGKELDSVRKSLEQEYQGKIDKVKHEKQELVAQFKALEANASFKNREVAKLNLELIIQAAESRIFLGAAPAPVLPIPKKAKSGEKVKPGEKAKKPGEMAKPVEKAKPGEDFSAELLAVKEENEKLKKELKSVQKDSARKASPQPARKASPPPAKLQDPSIALERDKIKKQLEEQEVKYQKMLGEIVSERDSLKSELNIFTASMAVPSDSDDPTTHVLRSQIVLLTAEIASSREKIAGLEGQTSQIKALQASLQKKELEIAGFAKVDHKKPAKLDFSEEIQEKNLEIKSLHEETLRLRRQIEELSIIPVAVIAEKSDDDSEKKELKALLKKLTKHNESLKKELEEFHGESAALLSAKLEKAKKKIAELSTAPVVEKASADLEQKLILANQEIEFLQSQLKDSGKPVAAFPSEELSRLNEELSLAHAEIEKLKVRSEEHKEIIKVDSKKPAKKEVNTEEFEKKIKELTRDLEQRPKTEDFEKLKVALAAQEKQLKEVGASQNQQLKDLNNKIAELTQNHAGQLKQLEIVSASASKESSETIAKINSQLSELEKIRKNLEKQLKSEISEKALMAAELEEVKKVAGQAAELTKQVGEMTIIIAGLREKAVIKDTELKDSLRQRKLLHNQLEDMKGKIRVFCRIRPLSNSENERGCTNITTIVDEFTLTCEAKPGIIKPYMYDSIFGPNSTQDEVFEDTKRVVQSAIDGYNVCVFAYGQTGSGKTFTMQGDARNPGITPKAMDELFSILNAMPGHFKWEVSCYMIEIYLDNLVDLFLPKDFKGTPPSLSIKNNKGIIVIPEAKIYFVKNSKEILAKFDEGNLMRHTSSTKMNDTSSRSHLVFGVLIDVTNTETTQRTVGKLSLVDLAGSERVSKTEATAERLKEGRAINKSLSALGDVINALSANESHIPYRNNKLTMLMSDSLGGNAKTLMFVNISPANYNGEETSQSLTYAARVKLITNEPSKNLETKEMTNLKSEVMMLTTERDRYRNALEKNGFNLSNLDEIPENKEDFDDPKYDDL